MDSKNWKVWKRAIWWGERKYPVFAQGNTMLQVDVVRLRWISHEQQTLNVCSVALQRLIMLSHVNGIAYFSLSLSTFHAFGPLSCRSGSVGR